MKSTKWISILLLLVLLVTHVAPAVATAPAAVSESEGTDVENTEDTAEEVPEESSQRTDGFSVKRYAPWEAIFKSPPKAAMLIELGSDTVLYALDMHEQNYPASLTKIMTCLLALQYGNLNDVLTVSATALENLHESGSTADLQEGEQMTLEHLLYCTMISSANEACNVIAEHISGSVEAFVELMNTTATELGCLGTHFANPHGLHDEDHYTTAYDLSLITR